MARGKKAGGSSALVERGTKRKQVEEALRESEERFRSIVENSQAGIMIIDEAYRLIYVNPELCRISGYSQKGLIGHDFREFLDGESRRLVAERYIQRQRGEEVPPRYEFNIIRKDGEKRRVEISSAIIKDSAGEVRTVAQILDISERKQAEEALRESREELRKMFESVTDGISVIGLNGVITEVNQRTLEIHGYKSKDELIGKSALRLVAPRDHEKILKNMRKALEGTIGGVEYTLLRADGTEFPGELSTSALKDASGNWIGHITIVRDITERKRAEAELKEAQERLVRSEKLAAIGQLASGVGHELRNPLGAIKTAVAYVRRKVAATELVAIEPRVLEFLALMDEEVSSANKVVTDLLDFARVAKPTVSLVNASSIINDATTHVALPENVRLTIDVDPDLPMVMVDATQIRQVFVNVILNAAEAMPEGGRLEIKARGKDDLVTVEFTDTGGGIPESLVGKIFDPLFTTKPRGVGLGLAVCKSIMEKHGGDIRVQSKEGEGTTFTVSLPTRPVQGDGGEK